jgi:hypothetical protein
VTPLGIDPGTIQQVAQCLYIYIYIYIYTGKKLVLQVTSTDV